MREYYDPELSKTDPLKIVHIKIPSSVLRVLKREASKIDRYHSYLIRNILIDWERNLRTKQAKPEGEASLEIPSPQGFTSRKRKG